MKFRFIWLATLIGTLAYASSSHAAFIDYFKDELGETNWQYVANFSGTVLILLLSLTAVTLLFNYGKLRRTNRELQEIRKSLEVRVRQRTADLEGEIEQHRETTARLEVSEAYIKSILDSMPLMLIGLDDEMRITQWNKSAENTSGIPGDEVIGEYLWDAYPTITLLPDQVKDVIEHKKTINIKQSQSNMFYFDITLYALKTSRGTGIVILVDDVTQQTKTENLLIQRDKMSAIGELASTMGYDILSPLRSILDHLDSLLEKTDAKPDKKNNLEMKACLEDAVEKGTQASAIIDNLLHFSRSMGDEKRLSKIPDVIDHSLELAETLFFDSSGLKFKDIKIVRNYEENLPSILSYNSGLQQVFLSLIRHACQSLAHTNRENEAPVISIDVSKFYDSLWVKIQHNGLGLTSEEQQTIFEPYFQNTAENEAEIESRLSFSYYIITEDHRGHMSVTSDVNVGTTFHIQLQLLV